MVNFRLARRIAALSVCALIAGFRAQHVAWAEPPPASRSPNFDPDRFRAAINERMEFATSTYSLNETQAASLRSWIVSQAPAQRDYLDRFELTLRRREKALRMLGRMTGMTDETRRTVAERMQDQIFAIHAAGPLSLANVAKEAEAMLTPGEIQDGRKRIGAAHPELVVGGKVDISRLDRLIIAPVETNAVASQAASPVAAAPAQSISAPPAQTNSPPPATEVKPAPAESIKSAPAVPTPKVESAAAPPARSIDPAPPLENWGTAATEIVDRYHFEANQKTTAIQIMKAARVHCVQYRRQHEAEFRAANANPDEAERKRILDELNKPVDVMFDVMRQRIEAIARIDQKNPAAASQPAAHP